MDLELEPGKGVGPVRLGMTADEAKAALETLGPLEQTALGEVAMTMPNGLRISLSFGVAGPTRQRVDGIEVWRSCEHDRVHFRGIDVFNLPAAEVLEKINSHTPLIEYEEGSSYAANDLFLALWRPFADDDPEEESGYYFQTAGVAYPGYADTPAEAEAREAAGGTPGH
jgi:hypothetical protein